jgi:hypothetical protein
MYQPIEPLIPVMGPETETCPGERCRLGAGCGLGERVDAGPLARDGNPSSAVLAGAAIKVRKSRDVFWSKTIEVFKSK